MRKRGLACDNLLSAEVVTADGRLVRASEAENADLFWGLRGGGGNFGVVTSFEFRLHPVGPVLAGMVIHPVARAREVLRFYRDYAAAAPDELTMVALLLTHPEAGPVVAIAACYGGPHDTGEPVLRPLHDLGPPIVDLIQPMSYVQAQSLFDAAFPAGVSNYWKSSFLTALSDETIDIMTARFATVPSPFSALVVEQCGGAVKRVPRDATAFAHRDANFNLLVVAMWPDPAATEANVAWARETWAAVQPFAGEGVYVNYLSDGEADRVTAAYGVATHDRLVALKHRYDPSNRFRFNQNIRPAASPVE